mmetsp:Transcript_56803/g.184020  ORF Transcript_56803/g.184020 Transcript_56803/m.184020 type:complete len:266 (+) Transcript_56803:306-1103(+)
MESATEFDHFVRVRSLGPSRGHSIGINFEVSTTIQGIEHLPRGQSFSPRQAELRLELLGWHIQLDRLLDRGLGGNGIVVLIDEFLLVDGLPLKGALGHYLDASLPKPALDQLLGRLCHGMRLDEHERGIEHDILLIQRREGDEPVEACPCIHVLKLVEDGTLLAIFDGHLRVQRPCLDHRLRYASGEHPFAKDVIWNSDAQPIVALCEAFEGRRRSMHTVVADVGHHLKPELIPLRKYLPSQRVSRGLRRVCRAQHLTTEVCPRQ